MLWLAGFLGFFTVLLAVATYVLATRYAVPIFRKRIVQALSTQFQSNVTLGSLDVSLRQGFDVFGQDLEIQPKSLLRYPPVIAVRRFRCHVEWVDLLDRRIHIRQVNVEGMQINFPPNEARNQTRTRKKSHFHFRNTMLVLDRVNCSDALVTILTDRPEKIPLNFKIRNLQLLGLAPGQSMRFTALMTNPRPLGEVASQGTLGPWNAEYPGRLPTTGQYIFQHGDLSTTNGISGFVSSTGYFHGTLDHIDVDGTTDTPDFRINSGGAPVRLQTQFHAIVDGTSGNTYLEPVHAQFLNSSLVASGKIVRAPVGQGHRVSLEVHMNQARVEDLLRLGVKAKTPTLTGRLQLAVRFDLFPGTQNIMDRMMVQGTFLASNARFTNPRTQDKINSLSLRAQGMAREAKYADTKNVDSEMQGDVTLVNNVVTFHPLHYQAPGVKVLLNGTYELDTRMLNLNGTARMDAEVSQMMTGVKSFLLRPLNPMFRRNGAGTEVAIQVSGPESNPKLGLTRVQ